MKPDRVRDFVILGANCVCFFLLLPCTFSASSGWFSREKSIGWLEECANFTSCQNLAPESLRSAGIIAFVFCFVAICFLVSSFVVILWHMSQKQRDRVFCVPWTTFIALLTLSGFLLNSIGVGAFTYIALNLGYSMGWASVLGIIASLAMGFFFVALIFLSRAPVYSPVNE
jgi:hypothetical protein